MAVWKRVILIIKGKQYNTWFCNACFTESPQDGCYHIHVKEGTPKVCVMDGDDPEARWNIVPDLEARMTDGEINEKLDTLISLATACEQED